MCILKVIEFIILVYYLVKWIRPLCLSFSIAFNTMDLWARLFIIQLFAPDYLNTMYSTKYSYHFLWFYLRYFSSNRAVFFFNRFYVRITSAEEKGSFENIYLTLEFSESTTGCSWNSYNMCVKFWEGQSSTQYQWIRNA